MAKDPAFLFYSADFMMGTALMSEVEVGQYIRIMCHMHQSGHLSMEDMKNICPNISSKVVAKFKADDNGLFYNERLDAEINKRKSYSESRRNNRLKNKKESYDNTYDQSYVHGMTGHMENENINGINGIKRKEKNESKLSPQILDPNDYYTSGQQAFEDMKGDELFIENLERVVHQNGFRACGKLAIALAVKKFLTIEAAKPEFMIRPRRDIRSHLVNWVNVNAEKVASYETERV